MPTVFDDIDIHTHNVDAEPGSAVINLPQGALLHPDEFILKKGGLYSVGIHPWWTDDAENLPLMLENLQKLAHNEQIVCLGECGFDRLRGNIAIQPELFAEHVRLSEALHKPLLIHCVRAYDMLLQACKNLPHNEDWIIHGFRGKESLAEQLLKAGFMLSYGTHFSQEAYDITPADRRFHETDEDF